MGIPIGYSFYNIEATLFCIAAVSILLFKQLTVFNEDEVQRAFTKILFVQLGYFVSMIIRVLVDTSVLPHTQTTYYIANLTNFALYGYCGYLVFVYQKLAAKAPCFS